MTEPASCPECGATLPPDAPGGFCPRCLLRHALDAGEAGPPSAEVTVSFGPGDGGALAGLAETLGGIPRVLLRDTDPESGPPPVEWPDSPELPPPADRPAKYQLFGEIARGGMGAVPKARDPDLGRELALKVLLERHKDKPELVRRFLEEAQIGGQLQHPGIVPVYDLGAFADHRPFFAMKLVKGRTLAALLAARTGPADDLPKLLGIFAQVCQTVAYAHARGVIRRDLKPSNVMVGSFGAVQVMDWGPAKVLRRGGAADDDRPPTGGVETVVQTARSGSDADASRAGSVLGTPAYMAPEQARGEVDAVDERADVFALGSILCEVLTGAPAFVGRGSGEIQRRAAHGETDEALGRLAASEADAELIALATDCLAAEAPDRPRDAGAVADRATAYLAGVQERLRAAELAKVAAQTRAAEEAPRRRLVVALAGAVVGLVAVGGGGGAYLWQQRQARAAQVDLALREAETLRDQAERAGGDLTRWAAAREAARRGEQLLDDARDAPTRRRVVRPVREIRVGAEMSRRDHLLLDRLAEIRGAKADDPTGSATDAAYAAAFRDAGLDPDTMPPGAAGPAIRARPAAVSLAVAATLDDWAAARRRRRDGAGARRLTEAARTADPDPWRVELRRALDLDDRDRRLAALRTLVDSARVDALPAVSLDLPGRALLDAGDAAGAEAPLRAAQRLFPGDVWLNLDLAECLERRGRREEAIRYYTAARALRPETSHRLAHALLVKGESEEAIAVFRDLARRRPKVGRHLHWLGFALFSRGRSEESNRVRDAAVVALREAIRLRPDDADAHSYLGLVPSDQGKRKEAITACRAAVRLNPEDAAGHFYLAVVLRHNGAIDEAIAEFRKATRLQPDFADAYSGLGSVLEDKGAIDEAIVAYREAIRAEPEHSEAFFLLGCALAKKGQLDEAVEAFRASVRHNPHSDDARIVLGGVFRLTGARDEMWDQFREAVRINPGNYAAYFALGDAHRDQGGLDAAIAAYRQGHEMALRINPERAPALARKLREAERLATLAVRLPAVLRGEDQPADDAERRGFAELCFYKQLYGAAARLYGEAFAADPGATEHRYRAICAAALAGSGRGRDDPHPDGAQRARLRQQALGWLKAELATWSKALDSGNPRARAAAAPVLRRWQKNHDLAGVRDPDALTARPEGERADWQALWGEMDHLLERAGKAP